MNISNSARTCLLLLILGYASVLPVTAEQNVDNTKFANQVDSDERNHKAKLRELEREEEVTNILLKIAKNRAEIQGTGANLQDVPFAASILPAPPQQTFVVPEEKAIFNSPVEHGRLKAIANGRAVYEIDGREQYFKIGDMLPDGGVLVRVLTSSVITKKNGEQEQLYISW